MPQRAAIITYSNKYHMQLLQLQHESTHVLGGVDERCLAWRFVTVCLDGECYDECLNMKLHNCVLVATSNVVYPPSQFLQGAFFYLSFVKYLIIREALTQATELFFVDADVLLYCNPWLHLRLFSNSSDYEYVYCPEYVNRRNYINGGQYYLRNTKKVQEWLRLIIKSRQLICEPQYNSERETLPFIKSSKVKHSPAGLKRPQVSSVSVNRKPKKPLLDQDYARIFAEKAGLRYTWAPIKELGSHNHYRANNFKVFPPTACTNHVCGITGEESATYDDIAVIACLIQLN